MTWKDTVSNCGHHAVSVRGMNTPNTKASSFCSREPVLHAAAVGHNDDMHTTHHGPGTVLHAAVGYNDDMHTTHQGPHIIKTQQTNALTTTTT